MTDKARVKYEKNVNNKEKRIDMGMKTWKEDECKHAKKM